MKFRTVSKYSSIWGGRDDCIQRERWMIASATNMHYANRERDREEDRKWDRDSGSGIGFGSQAGTEARDNINEGRGTWGFRAMGRGSKTDVSRLRAEAAAAWGAERASASASASASGRRGRGGDVWATRNVTSGLDWIGLDCGLIARGARRGAPRGRAARGTQRTTYAHAGRRQRQRQRQRHAIANASAIARPMRRTERRGATGGDTEAQMSAGNHIPHQHQRGARNNAADLISQSRGGRERERERCRWGMRRIHKSQGASGLLTRNATQRNAFAFAFAFAFALWFAYSHADSDSDVDVRMWMWMWMMWLWILGAARIVAQRSEDCEDYEEEKAAARVPRRWRRRRRIWGVKSARLQCRGTRQCRRATRTGREAHSYRQRERVSVRETDRETDRQKSKSGGRTQRTG